MRQTTQNLKRKIVVYSHDTFGLGNIRRMLEIAKSLVKSDPNVSILILSGSPMLHAFRIPPQIDYIKLPCLTRTQDGTYAAKFLDMNYAQIVNLRSNLIQSSIIDFDPDLILVDKKPFGVGDELKNALNVLKNTNHRAKLVLLLRDILDSAESTMRIWQKNGYHHAIQTFYDQVLVVGSPEVFDLREEYKFPLHSRNKVRFCGYIAREPGRSSRQQIREQFGIGNEKMVLVTPGGGEDGYHLIRSYLQGIRMRKSPLGAKSLVICGPEQTESHRQHIQTLAEGCPDVILQSFTDDMMACMNAADLVISMGGYNTVCELLTLAKPAIVVPRVAPVQEQWIRSERMAELGLLRSIHPDKVTPTAIMATVDEELAKHAVNQKVRLPINLRGLEGVREAVCDLLEHPPVKSQVLRSVPLKMSQPQQVKMNAAYLLRMGHS